VTTDGEYISKNRFLKGGSRNKQAGVRLGLKDKLEKLDKKEKDIHRQITDKESVLEDIQQKFGLLNLETIRQDIKESQKKLREYEQTMSRFQSSIQVYEKSISDLKNRQDTLVGNRELAVDELEQLQPQQKEFQQKILELSNKQDKLKVELQNLEEERAIAQNRFNDARLKHQDVTNRADNLSKDIERAENGIISVKSRLESRSELLIQSTEKIKSYSKSIDESKVELEKLTLQKEAAESKLKEAEQASSQQRGLINEND
jgi:chromosome segregation protein